MAKLAARPEVSIVDATVGRFNATLTVAAAMTANVPPPAVRPVCGASVMLRNRRDSIRSTRHCVARTTARRAAPRPRRAADRSDDAAFPVWIMYECIVFSPFDVHRASVHQSHGLDHQMGMRGVTDCADVYVAVCAAAHTGLYSEPGSHRASLLPSQVNLVVSSPYHAGCHCRSYFRMGYQTPDRDS